MYPRIIAIFLNAYTVKSTICTQLIHDDSSPSMPDSFEDPLRIFGRLFTTRLDSSNLHSRQKRGGSSFNNFLTWITGDTPQRIYNIETVEMTHLHKINKLIDQSQETSLSIDQNSKELDVIYNDLKNDEIQIKDINLKVDLMKVFSPLHSTYLHNSRRLSDFQASYSALLLEFKVSLQIDIEKINKCILQQQICFYRHGNFFCAEDCFLTSDYDFASIFNYRSILKFMFSTLHACTTKLV